MDKLDLLDVLRKHYSIIPNLLKIYLCSFNRTRMTTFMKTKFKISDIQTNIDKYRLAANITVYSISYYIKINLTTNHYYKL